MSAAAVNWKESHFCRKIEFVQVCTGDGGCSSLLSVRCLTELLVTSAGWKRNFESQELHLSVSCGLKGILHLTAQSV